MISILLTVAVCASPIPINATNQEVAAAKCEYAVKATTSSYQQCEMVRDAFLRSVGKVNFYGYFICASDRDGFDEGDTIATIPRVSFNSKKGI